MANLNLKLVVFDADNTRRHYEAAAQRLGHDAAKTAFRRALNHTGDKARTAVRRAIRKQTSIPDAIVRRYMSVRRANYERLSYEIIGFGSEIPLKYFGARQFSFGVRAKVWGKFQKFKGTFIVASEKMGGHVWHRTSKKRLPIEKLYGPSVPKEMIKDQSLEAFETTANQLAARAEHEIARILNA